jgi:hypothetical protein
MWLLRVAVEAVAPSRGTCGASGGPAGICLEMASLLPGGDDGGIPQPFFLRS